jgi:hypothetical protein
VGRCGPENEREKNEENAMHEQRRGWGPMPGYDEFGRRE